MTSRPRGDGEAARKDLDAAIVIFERLESHLELGRALVFRGGDDGLAPARELFQSCGAPTNFNGSPCGATISFRIHSDRADRVSKRKNPGGNRSATGANS